MSKLSLIALPLLAIVACAWNAGAAVGDTKRIGKPKSNAQVCQWGAPGCPYPSLGTRRVQKTAPGKDCGKGMYKGGDGECYPLLH
jgi:hypothetical protein